MVATPNQSVQIGATAEIIGNFTSAVDRDLLNGYLHARGFEEEHLSKLIVTLGHKTLNPKKESVARAPTEGCVLGEFEVIKYFYANGSAGEGYRIELDIPQISELSEMGLRVVDASYQPDISIGSNASSVLVHELEHLWEYQVAICRMKRLGLRAVREFLGGKAMMRRLAIIEEERRVLERTRNFFAETPDFANILRINRRANSFRTTS